MGAQWMNLRAGGAASGLPHGRANTRPGTEGRIFMDESDVFWNESPD